MTYGVPYSFVPGTKAKADEINANFIEIVNKIETSNSNLNDSITTKADKSELDGNWVGANINLIGTDTSMSANSSQTFDLSSYLPDTDSIYEVIVTGIVRTLATSGSTSNPNISSEVVNFCRFGGCVTRTSATAQGSGTIIIPCKGSITLTAPTAMTVNKLDVVGYRRVK